MQILLSNVGYLLGQRDSLGGYLPSPREAIMGDDRLERQSIETLLDLVTTERPDVTCLVEVDRGSARTMTDGQLAEVLDRLHRHGIEYTGRIYNKYGDASVFGRLPFFRHLGNAVLLNSDYPTAPRYLAAGMKRLVIEVRLPQRLTLLLVHLSVRAGSRQRQLRELTDLVNHHRQRGRVIVAGDLNTYRGIDELREFLEHTGLEVHAPGETVSERLLDEFLVSSRALDMFLCSPDVAVERSEVLSERISDHRPVMLDVRI